MERITMGDPLALDAIQPSEARMRWEYNNYPREAVEVIQENGRRKLREPNRPFLPLNWGRSQHCGTLPVSQ